MKNMDADQVTKIMAEHRKTIKLIFLVGALLLAGLMFNGYRVKEKDIRARMAQEQGKLVVIKAREAAIEDLSKFKSGSPKALNVFDLITLISNYAKSCDSSITSYTPNQSKDMGLYDAINVSFIAESGNFHDMVLFLRKIEKSDSPIMIDEWSGNEEENGKITLTITISAVQIHP